MSEELLTPEPVPSGDRPGRLGILARLAVDTRPLRHRDFRNLWIGQAVSTLGGMIGTVAVPFQMYALTGSTLYVGLLGLAALVPLLVDPLWGGAIADAGDRRSVLLRTETGMTIVTGLFLGNALLPNPQVWALFVLEAVAVSIYSLGRPAMSSRAVLRDTMLMRATPDHMRGRLSEIEFTQVAGAPNLGNLEAGVVASLTSLRTSVVSGGVLCIVGCIATAVALPRFLRYDASRPLDA